MKEYVVLFFVASILTIAVINSLYEKQKHQTFFNDMREFKKQTESFMSQGSRNTADMGLKLCDRLNELEFRTDITLTDCEAIYTNGHGQ